MQRLRAFWQRRLARMHRDDGISTLEFFVLAPILLIVLCAAVQMGIWYLGDAAAATAARKGAETGSSYQSTPAEGAARAHRWLAGIGIVRDVNVSTAGSTGEKVQITVDAQVMNFLPFLDISIHRSAEDIVEQ
ncbi:TadE/TadG family type IV pilus assembly protein [Streptomyces sp. B-S-A8]|uniref:TadE/TadG family type IV pilus assembly protein n=1 Tax=Streptomyces solicavernae TaxID=3043614 RepID=A0ABT6S030_9ACTN|nr:TadE/TadG family type IV pilus assembly protein [Streptomyces sp. B-S-A8]MDI3390048.1 TadE/TadG family type IV pilus assembly protein [Streptomyces sp. B-S-A8]